MVVSVRQQGRARHKTGRTGLPGEWGDGSRIGGPRSASSDDEQPSAGCTAWAQNVCSMGGGDARARHRGEPMGSSATSVTSAIDFSKPHPPSRGEIFNAFPLRSFKDLTPAHCHASAAPGV